jgi:transposase
VRGTRVWARLLGLQRAVVEDVWIGDEGEVVVAARPTWRERDRCGICRRRSPGFDLGEGRRRWRALDLGTTLAFVEADAPRVSCRHHGVVVCAVPWARHNSRFTDAFEDQVCWLAVNCSKTAVAQLMRVAWRSVGQICQRVAAETARDVDLLDGLRRIGIDEISHRKGQRYLTVVVCHDTGRLVWAAPGADRKTVEAFLDALGEERCKQVELVSCDMAAWIAAPITERLPDAVRCVDPFHVVQLATDALDEIRREVWNEARRPDPDRPRSEGRAVRAVEEPRAPHRAPTGQARRRAEDQPAALPRLPAQGAAPPDLPAPGRRRDRAVGRLDHMGQAMSPRTVPQARQHGHRAAPRDRRGDPARPLQRSRRGDQHTQIRLITRRAFGFHSPDALIALAMLSLADLCPPLPR